MKGLLFLKDNKIRGGPEACFIRSDQMRIKQVLFNLMNNALKYTEVGFIKISLEEGDSPDANEGNRLFLIKVTDSGVGIKENELPYLFRMTGRIKESKMGEKEATGVGLGLSITKRLLEILNQEPGQNIQVESEYGKGSTFTIKLKSYEEIVENKDPEEEAYSENNEFLKTDISLIVPGLESKSNINLLAPPNERIIRVLLVDDDQINIIVGSSFLKSIGSISFDTANNGVQALEKINRNAKHSIYYDIILMDCNMPLMDGLQATVEIKKLIDLHVLPKIWIIACTANASLEDKQKCFDAGMNDFLVKPFSKDNLEEKIKSFTLNKLNKSDKIIECSSIE